MSRIVRLQQTDLTFGFFLRNLTQDIFGEMMLKFAEGSHAVVNPIEQDENTNPGERATSKPEQETLDQAGTNRDRRSRHFHDGHLIPAIHHLGDIDLLQIIRQPIIQCFEAIDFAFDAIELCEALT